MADRAVSRIVTALLWATARVVVGAQEVQSPLLPDYQANASSTCHDACTKLANTLGCEVYHESLPTRLFDDYYSQQQREVVPACIVLPTSSQDVSQAAKIISEHECIFAVKSGGHAMFAGASNAPQGITMDLRYLNDIGVSETGATAFIGTGNRWKDVYAKLDPMNITVVGGRDQEVGVGGFILGGGISFLSRRHGWAFDNVQNYEVVLANGSITNVSLSSHPDLYFALRGGGNNFGIVTRFDLDTYPQTDFWGGQIVLLISDAESRRKSLGIMRPFDWTPTGLFEIIGGWANQLGCLMGFCSSIEAISHTMENFYQEGRQDPYTHMYTYMVLLPSIHVYVIGAYTVNGRPEPHPPAFNSFRALTPRKIYATQKTKSLVEMSAEIGGEWNPAGFRQTHVSTVFRLDSSLIKRSMEIWMEEIEPIRHVKGLFPAMVTQIIGEDEITHFSKHGGNAIGLSPDEGPLIIISAVIRWSDKKEDERVLGAARNSIARIEALAKEMGVYHPFIYQNYAAKGQNVFGGYKPENLERLRKISKKYDPREIFTRLQPGYFNLW